MRPKEEEKVNLNLASQRGANHNIFPNVWTLYNVFNGAFMLPQRDAKSDCIFLWQCCAEKTLLIMNLNNNKLYKFDT